MKKSIFLALGALALFTGVSAGVSATMFEGESEPVYAADTKYSLIGTFYGKSWNTDYFMQTTEREGYDAHYTVVLNEGEKFKVRYNQSWDDDKCWGWAQVASGDLKSNFLKQDGSNIEARISGSYEVWFNASSHEILVEYSDTGASYVFAQKEYTNAYIFFKENEGTQQEVVHEPWSWDYAPAYYVLPIQKANDMRIDNSGGSYHNYHAFRINQNLLNYYKVVLKGDMGQSCDLYATTESVIMDTGNGGAHTTYATTNGYYKLCKMMVDISGSMGASTYQGRDYIYSICNTSQAQSAAIAAAYDGLLVDSDATVRNITPKVVLKTYNDFNAQNVEHSKADIAISKIIEVLRKKGTGAIVTPSTALTVTGLDSKGSTALIAGLATIGVAAAGTMVFFAKKRKEI